MKTLSDLPTAREFYDKHYSDDPVVIMKDYAKLIKNTALLIASQNATSKTEIAIFMEGQYQQSVVDKESILNSFPDEYIK